MSDDLKECQMGSGYAKINTSVCEDDYNDSIKQENKVKSRRPDILPPNRYRPALAVTNQDQDQSDYINAVFISTFLVKNGLILNQLPLENTRIDTIRMIWQFNLSTIIVMEKVVEKECSYWPNTGNSEANIGPFAVERVSEENKDGIITRKIKFKNTESAEVKEVVQLHYQHWPENQTVPENIDSILFLVSNAEKISRNIGGNIPLLVQCLDGATRSGLFSMIWLVLERIKSDQTVAIADTVRMARVRRKQIIPNYEQYRFLWDAVKKYIEKLNPYGNVM